MAGVMLGAALVVIVGAAAYASSFRGAFVFDDFGWIVDNLALRRPWDFWGAMFPPDAGLHGGRPVVSLTLAVNYWLARAAAGPGHDISPWGFHAVNLVIHLLSALALFGVARRTFLSPALRDRLGGAATLLATAIAAIWVVHPLTTAAVTYIIQRTESLAALFYLWTLYCLIRGATAQDRALENPNPSQPATRGLWWYVGAVVACWLGMATKEIVVSAPVIALLYDRTFLSGSFRVALQRRWGLYLALAASWAVIVAVLALTKFHGDATGFGVNEFTWWTYLCTQPGVILHYLWLSVWPANLSIDTGWPPATTVASIALPGAIVLALVALTIWALVKRPAWGFLGAVALAVLAPTSSFVPIRDAEFDHRMYLPLAALVALVALGIYTLVGRLFSKESGRRLAVRALAAGAAALVVALGIATVKRNEVFASPESVWQDALDKNPRNARAFASLAWTYSKQGKLEEAAALYARALQIRPDFIQVYEHLITLYGDQGDYPRAIDAARRVTAADPGNANAENSYGSILSDVGQIAEAKIHWRRAMELDARAAMPRANLGLAYLGEKKIDQAVELCRSAVALDPDQAEARINLATCLAVAGKPDEAIVQIKEALRLNPTKVEAQFDLGLLLEQQGKLDQAAEALRRAQELRPDDPRNPLALGEVLARLGKPDAARDAVEEAVKQADAATARQISNPQKRAEVAAEAHMALAALLAARGDAAQALVHQRRAVEWQSDNPRYRERYAAALVAEKQYGAAVEQFKALSHQDPNNTGYLSKLADLLLLAQQPDEAVKYFEAALQIAPKDAALHDHFAVALMAQVKLPAAADQLKQAITAEPGNAQYHMNYGSVLYMSHDPAGAIGQWREAIKLNPRDAHALANLALALATCWDEKLRSGAEAVKLAKQAVELTDGKDANSIAVLATAQAEAGDFDEAVKTGKQARQRAVEQHNTALAKTLDERLKLYESRKPYHDSPPK